MIRFGNLGGTEVMRRAECQDMPRVRVSCRSILDEYKVTIRDRMMLKWCESHHPAMLSAYISSNNGAKVHMQK